MIVQYSPSLLRVGVSAEIPQLATELFEMSKSYLDQEAIQPLKRTGRYAAFSMAGGGLFAVGWMLIAVAGVRAVRYALPATELFSVLAYILGALAALSVGALLIWRASKAAGIR